MEKRKYKQNEKKLFWGVWIVSVIVTIIIFNPFKLYFLNDDFIYIPQSEGGKYLYGTSFRPVSDITLLLDYLLYGKKAWGYHLTNLLIHFIATFSVFQLAKQCIDFFKVNVSPWAAHLTALFFLFYAFHSESVFWIIGRGASLVTIFFAISLKLVLKKRTKNWELIVSVLLFALGLITYESIWVLPVIVVMVALYKIFIYKIDKEVFFIEPTLYWTVLLMSFIIKKWWLNDFIGSPYHYSINTFTAVKGLVYDYLTGFFRSFMFPANAIYFVVGCAFVIVFLIWLLITGIKKRWFTHIDVFLGICFFTSLTPIALLGVNTHNTESERFLYLPSIFICLFFSIHILSIKTSSLKNALIIVFFGYNIVFLIKASTAYKVASAANKMAMQTIGTINGRYNTVHVVNLPTQYNGGFMFRLAFANALDWMCPNLKYNQMVVHSRIEYLKPIKIIATNTLPNTTVAFITSKQISIDSTKDLLIAWDGEKLYVK